MDLSNPSITGIKLIFCHNPSSHAFRASEARPGIQEQRNWFPAFAGTMSGFPPSRSCRNVIAREGNDRSNLISSRIHEITTTPERRLVTCDLKGYDKEALRHSLPPEGDKQNVTRKRGKPCRCPPPAEVSRSDGGGCCNLPRHPLQEGDKSKEAPPEGDNNEAIRKGIYYREKK